MIRPVRGLTDYVAYDAPSTAEIARRAGLPPQRILRFDGNTSPQTPPYARAELLTEELARIHTYPHGGYEGLTPAIAAYAGVSPENVVVGAGADDVIMLVVRSFAGRGDRVAIANDPTYPLFAIAVGLAGATVDDQDPALTICCIPNNPTGEIRALPKARPLLVDEAYFEYSGVTAADAIDDGAVVVRTFSKAFGLAGARVGYALAGRDVAGELNRRQGPAPLSTLSVALALAALAAGPPDVTPIIAERERLTSELANAGFSPLPSHGNFVAVPLDDGAGFADGLLQRGIAVRPYRDGVRITVRTPADDDRLLEVIRG
jgi:histidinol-phosphate/aromatic aminotransferase/cobyric acid decarboxylase-like protein